MDAGRDVSIVVHFHRRRIQQDVDEDEIDLGRVDVTGGLRLSTARRHQHRVAGGPQMRGAEKQHVGVIIDDQYREVLSWHVGLRTRGHGFPFCL